MKIKTLKFSLLLTALITIVVSCKSDDDSDDSSSFFEEDRTEQQEKDNDSIVTYLSSHYYNSSFFETGSDYKYTDIVIAELTEGETVPLGSTLLIDAVETLNTTYLEVDYTYYVLNLYQGDGDSPHFTDAVRVRYEGISINDALDGEVDSFDSSSIPTLLNLQTGLTSPGVIIAWQLIIPTFNVASNFGIDDNGNVNYANPGLGVMFVPSGLAFFSETNTGSSYDNLMFKFELLQFEIEDHDNDGIPSYIEDLDSDLDVTNEDTDGDGFPNFIDVDDDGDGVLTINELLPTTYTVDTNVGEVEPILASNEFERSRVTVNGVITINTVTLIDTDDNGTPDYLDATITINYNE